MTDEDRIGDILLTWEDEFEQGKDVPLEELCKDYPDLAGEVAERIESLKRTRWLLKLGQVATEQSSAAAHQARPSSCGSLPTRQEDRHRRLRRGLAGLRFGVAADGGNQDAEAESLTGPGTGGRLPSRGSQGRQPETPHIVPIFDVGREGKFCFPRLGIGRGRSAPTSSPARRVPPTDAARFVAQIAEVLHYAHQQGFIHRDVKAANVLIDHHGRGLLCDFGIAVIAGNQPARAAEVCGRCRRSSCTGMTAGSTTAATSTAWACSSTNC